MVLGFRFGMSRKRVRGLFEAAKVSSPRPFVEQDVDALAVAGEACHHLN